MENLSKYTPTELLKMINDSTTEHERLKKEIVDHTIEVDELEIKINAKINRLTEAEKEYVELIEELNNRENAV
jgi:hypothetical protein